jgi:hypothetical protein
MMMFMPAIPCSGNEKTTRRSFFPAAGGFDQLNFCVSSARSQIASIGCTRHVCEQAVLQVPGAFLTGAALGAPAGAGFFDVSGLQPASAKTAIRAITVFMVQILSSKFNYDCQ